MGIDVSERLNPWFSIWTQPRRTIRQILQVDPTLHVALMAAGYGVARGIERVSNKDYGEKLPLSVILLLVAIGGPLGGIFTTWWYPMLLSWTGGWLGGKADTQQVRAAWAWSSVPLIWQLPLWGVLIALLGRDLFLKEPPSLEGNLGLAFLVLAIWLLILIAWIWSYVIYFKCLSEVQQFSFWAAIANSLLATMFILVPGLLLMWLWLSSIPSAVP